MEKNKNIDAKIEQALNSLDNVERAEPRPFLFTRVMARINATSDTPWERAGKLISRPAIALPGLAMIILMNVLVFAFNHRSSVKEEEQSSFVTSGDFSSANTINEIVNTTP